MQSEKSVGQLQGQGDSKIGIDDLRDIGHKIPGRRQEIGSLHKVEPHGVGGPRELDGTGVW